jgi:hypothetical protein
VEDHGLQCGHTGDPEHLVAKHRSVTVFSTPRDTGAGGPQFVYLLAHALINRQNLLRPTRHLFRGRDSGCLRTVCLAYAYQPLLSALQRPSVEK